MTNKKYMYRSINKNTDKYNQFGFLSDFLGNKYVEFGRNNEVMDEYIRNLNVNYSTLKSALIDSSCHIAGMNNSNYMSLSSDFNNTLSKYNVNCGKSSIRTNILITDKYQDKTIFDICETWGSLRKYECFQQFINEPVMLSYIDKNMIVTPMFLYKLEQRYGEEFVMKFVSHILLSPVSRMQIYYGNKDDNTILDNYELHLTTSGEYHEHNQKKNWAISDSELLIPGYIKPEDFRTITPFEADIFYALSVVENKPIEEIIDAGVDIDKIKSHLSTVLDDFEKQVFNCLYSDDKCYNILGITYNCLIPGFRYSYANTCKLLDVKIKILNAAVEYYGYSLGKKTEKVLVTTEQEQYYSLNGSIDFERYVKQKHM